MWGEEGSRLPYKVGIRVQPESQSYIILCLSLINLQVCAKDCIDTKSISCLQGWRDELTNLMQESLPCAWLVDILYYDEPVLGVFPSMARGDFEGLSNNCLLCSHHYVESPIFMLLLPKSILSFNSICLFPHGALIGICELSCTNSRFNWVPNWDFREL